MSKSKNWSMADILAKNLIVSGGAGKVINQAPLPGVSNQVYVFHIVPTPAPRLTRQDSWKKRPVVQQYWAFKDEMRSQAVSMGFTMSPAMELSFIVPTPESWSYKKQLQALGQPCKVKPDLDNYIKAVLDTFSDQDGFVWKLTASKTYGVTGKILITHL